MLRRTPIKRGTSQLKRSGFKQKTLEEVKTLQSSKEKKLPSQKATGSQLKSSQLQKKKKPTVAKLKKLADSAFSQYIRLRDSDKNGLAECITCGVKKPWKELQNGHFVSRSTNTLRYDELNCNAQCVGCNMFKSGNLFQYGLALDLKYGDGTAKKLHARRFETHKLTVDELQKIIADCKEYISENT